MTTNSHLERLSDAELLAATTSLVKRSNEATAELLLHLGEVDARNLYLERAHPSMFAFCTGALGLSEDATCNLLTVARAARRLPAVLHAHREGRVHLTGLRVLAPHLTEESADALLRQATGKSKRDLEVLAASLAPRPPVPDSIRKLPQPAAMARPLPPAETTESLFATARCSAEPADASDIPGARDASNADRGDWSVAPDVTSPSLAESPFATQQGRPARRATVTPLSGETFKVQFTASTGLRDKLKEAQALLRHSVPDGDLASVVERALDCLIADVKRKRFGIGCRPRVQRASEPRADAPATAAERSGGPACPPATTLERCGGPAFPPAPASVAPKEASALPTRHVPIAMRREVFERDDGRCTFVDASGRRCEERGGLEFDHVDGFARTHTHSIDGLRLRCRPHNQYAADLLYGREFMDAARRAPAVRPGADK